MDNKCVDKDIEESLAGATSPKPTWLDKKTGDPVDFLRVSMMGCQLLGTSDPIHVWILGQYIFTIQDNNTVIVRLGHNRSQEYIGHHHKDVYDYLDASFLFWINIVYPQTCL